MKTEDKFRIKSVSEKKLDRVRYLITLYKEKISFNKEWIRTHKHSAYCKVEIPEVKMKIEILKSVIVNLKWVIGSGK